MAGLDPIALMIIGAAFQAAWGLILLFIGNHMKKMSQDLAANTAETRACKAELHAMHVNVLQGFTLKEDFDKVRMRVHDIQNDVTMLKTRAQLGHD